VNPRSQNRDLGHPRMPGRLLPRAFFEASPELVAPKLLGKVLALRTAAGILAGRIVEVEAYLGPHHRTPDPAAHSYRGPTPRTRVLFGPAGYAYVYSIYGMYFCANITCETEDRAGCILLRALEPVAGVEQMARNRGLPPHGRRPVRGDPGLAQREITDAKLMRMLTSGPSRLCQAMGLTRAAHNEMDLLDSASPLQVHDDGFAVDEVLVTPRIGIHEAVDWPLRFALRGNACVSGGKSLRGSVRRVE